MKSLKKTIKSQSRILLVEGDRFLSKVMANKLLRLGFNISLANDGEEALNKIKNEEFDLILLDLLLSKMDGFEVLAEMKAANIVKLKVVVLVSMDKGSDIEKLKKMGIKDYIVTGDLSIDAVIDKIEKLLNSA